MKYPEQKIENNVDFSLEYTKPKIGEIYPVFGMVTNILVETENEFIIEINRTIKLTVDNREELKKIIKERIFETAIFICEFTDITDNFFYAKSKCIVFGKTKNNLPN